MSIIHSSTLPDVQIPEQHLTPFLFERFGDWTDAVAFIDGPSGRTMTFGEFESAVRALAGGLVYKGFGPGHVLAILAPNIPEYAVVFHGVAFAGGTVTTINPTYTAGEIRHQLNDAGATTLVTIGMFLDTAKEAVEGTKVEQIVTIDEVDGVTNLRELFGEPLPQQVDVDLDDVVVLPYSSGTTGLSKGVMLTHRNLVSNILQTGEPMEMTADESFIAVLPFFHIYGMQVLMNTGLYYGASIITMPRFDPMQFLQLNAEHGCTRAFVAPPIVVFLAKHPAVDSVDMSAMQQIFSGAAPLSAELALEAGARLDCEVVQGYGMTELSPVTHLTPPGKFKPGSAGMTGPNIQCRIVDVESGEDLGIDAEGELWIKGPMVMKGYLNNPEATEATIVEDGWLRTGDVAMFDADGHMYIVDRLKELIKYKGFQVPPAELEALLLTHPAVADSAVIGVPDPEAGELPVGYVVLKEGQQASEADILAFVAEKVATYKKLHRVTFLDEIPKSASGKILRRILRDQAQG